MNYFPFLILLKVICCSYSPNGIYILSGSSDNTLKIWESSTGNLLFTLNEHTSAVYGCAFSNDGIMVVSASSDNSLILWDAFYLILITTDVRNNNTFKVQSLFFHNEQNVTKTCKIFCTVKTKD